MTRKPSDEAAVNAWRTAGKTRSARRQQMLLTVRRVTWSGWVAWCAGRGRWGTPGRRPGVSLRPAPGRRPPQARRGGRTRESCGTGRFMGFDWADNSILTSPCQCPLPTDLTLLAPEGTAEAVADPTTSAGTSTATRSKPRLHRPKATATRQTDARIVGLGGTSHRHRHRRGQGKCNLFRPGVGARPRPRRSRAKVAWRHRGRSPKRSKPLGRPRGTGNSPQRGSPYIRANTRAGTPKR